MSLGDDRLATTDGTFIAEGSVGDVDRRLSPVETVMNVSVTRVVSDGTGAAPPAGTTIGVLVADHVHGSDVVLAGKGGMVRMALVPGEKHDPDTGEGSWSGWVLQDATTGPLWGVQRRIVSGALFGAVPSLAGAVLVAVSLGWPRRTRRPAWVTDAAPAVAGVALGILFGAGLADANSFLYPDTGDDGLIASAWPTVFLVVGLAAAALSQPVAPARAGTTACVVGTGVLLAPIVAVALLWPHPIDDRLALGPLSGIILVISVVAAIVIAAARWLRLPVTRGVAAGLLVGPAVALWLRTPADALAVPLVLVAGTAALDLTAPRLVRRLVSRWT